MSKELELLSGQDAGDLLTAVLSASGGHPLNWTVTQIDGHTVAYGVRVKWTDGTISNETLAAASPAPAGTARLTDGDTEIGMWRFPFDPDLPGLATACDQTRMTSLANQLGLPGEARPHVRAYRPRRRAVVEVTTPAGTVFVKVVRPSKVADLHALHRKAAGCPTPEPLGWTPDGLLVLAALPGSTLRAQLLAGKPALDVDSVVAVLDTLPATLATGPTRPTWGQKAKHYAEVVATTVPSLARRARAVAKAVDHAAPQGPPVPVHGDFYEAQLLVSNGRVTGLLDIDTAGRGERLDDAACLLAHLDVLAQIHPALHHPGPELKTRFEQDLDPRLLANRTAAVVLSLATGPYRVREPEWQSKTADRMALAEKWLTQQ